MSVELKDFKIAFKTWKTEGFGFTYSYYPMTLLPCAVYKHYSVY